MTHVAITGASSGIGEQLALAYAEPGVRLSLSARREEKLEQVAKACRRHGAEVATTRLDVRDEAAVEQWYRAEDAIRPIELIIINAGVFDGHGPGGTLETADEARRIIEINVIGAIATAQAAMSCMRVHRQGHIAIVSSLAAVLPAADAPSYSASKAALVAYCDAIRMLLAPDGVDVSVILPGHVKTAQTDAHVGSLTMILPPHRAASIIKRSLDKRRTYIAFPRMAHWLVRIGSILPWRLKAQATRHDRFHVRKNISP